MVVGKTKIAGDWAVARISYWYRVTPKAGGAAMEDIGKAITVF